MINDDLELIAAVARINEELQEASDYLGERNLSEAKVRFPRNYIKSASHYRNQLLFINDKTLLNNSSYALMLIDVYKWIVNRTDIFGVPKEMIVKEAICLIGSLCESFTKSVLKGKVGKHKGYKERTTYLLDKGLISTHEKSELDWIWDTRNNEHLFLLDFVEFNHYKVSDYNRARNAFNKLCGTLTNYRLSKS